MSLSGLIEQHGSRGTPPENKTGNIYGQLTVIGFYGRMGAEKAIYWLCRCDCGNEIALPSRRLSHTVKYPRTSCGKGRCRKSSQRFDTDEEATFRYLYKIHKKSSYEKHGCLSYEVWFGLVQQCCYICGSLPAPWNYTSRPEYHHRYITVLVNGIDRFDNSQGYTLENSRPCCTKCNHDKSDNGFIEHVNHQRKVVAYQDYLSNWMEVQLGFGG